MVCNFRTLAFASIALVACLAGPIARAESFSLADMLRVEGVGWAAIDPGGKWAVFERLRPYDELGDYSFRTYAARKSGHQVWRAPIDEPDKAERLPGLDQAAHTYLESFSPTGQFLALYQYASGNLSLVLYDMETGSTVTSRHTPSLARSGEQAPVWISESEIVFPAEPDGMRPSLTSVRADAAARLASAWKAAFEGKGVTATEVRTLGTGAPSGALVKLDAVTGNETLLARGRFFDLRLSPDRTRLALLRETPTGGDNPESSKTMEGSSYCLVVFDLVLGIANEMAPGHVFHPYTLDWSPDGDRLLGFGQIQGSELNTAAFVVVHVPSGDWAEFRHTGLDLASERERGWRQRPERAVFLGDDIAVFARLQPKGSREHTFSLRDMRPTALSDAAWYRVSRRGDVSSLTGGIEDVSGIPVQAGSDYFAVLGSGGVYRLSEDGQRSLLAALPDGRASLVHPGRFSTHPWVSRPSYANDAVIKLDTETGSEAFVIRLSKDAKPTTLRFALPTAASVLLAGSSAASAIVYQEPAPPAAGLHIAALEKLNTRYQLAAINEHLDGVSFGTWKHVTYKAIVPGSLAGKKELESCVLLPEGFDPGSPPPLIVDIYPGNLTSCRKKSPDFSAPYFFSPHLWASKGYAYVQLSTPRELIRTHDGPVAGLPAVVDSGISALVEQGYAEEGSISLFGFSQGGYSALYTAAHLDRFNAVIAVNGWSDLFSHYFGPQGVFAISQPAFGEFSRYDPAVGTDFAMGRTPFDDTEAYMNNSAVLLAPRIEAPVLLMHSDFDSFAMTQFDMMYAALQRSGKDARYVRYWGEGHGPSSPDNIRDMWARFDSFLSEHQPDQLRGAR